MMRSMALLTVFALAACAHQKVLEPAPGAALAPGKKNVAEASTAGVMLKVTGDSWKGDPPDLGTLFTPVRVAIENHSGKTLRVSYQDFSLAGGSGFKYAAIPPMKARGTLSADAARSSLTLRRAAWEVASPSSPRLRTAAWEDPPPSSPALRTAEWEGEAPEVQMARWEHRGFYVAPHFSYLYPGLEPWPGTFAYDPFYYDTYYARWPERLPTKDMISEALPEGVVKDGGSVSGFVYFQSVTGRESSVQFEMNLVDASNGSSFGVATIPFQTSQN